MEKHFVLYDVFCDLVVSDNVLFKIFEDVVHSVLRSLIDGILKLTGIVLLPVTGEGHEVFGLVCFGGWEELE